MEKLIKPSPALLMGEGQLSATADAPEGGRGRRRRCHPPKALVVQAAKGFDLQRGLWLMSAGNKFLESAWGMIEWALWIDRVGLGHDPEALPPATPPKT